MNREVMSRQMFRNGGVVYMAKGGRPEVVETFSAIFNTGDADKILDYFISHERELRRAAASNEKLGTMIQFIDSMETRKADETIAETQRLSEMPQTGMIEVPAPGGSTYMKDPRPFGGETPQPPINLETFFQEYRQTPTTPPQPQQPQQPGMMGEVPMQYFQEGGMAMPAPMPAAPGPEGIASLPNEAAMEAMPVEGVAREATQVGLDPAVVQQMLGEVDSTLGDLENAGSYEDVINGIREADAPIEARYKELAGFVGEEDAMRTPESVLTMVQPVIMMAGVDQGIGALASEEMTAPVTGDMAGGIMSTVNMGQEGVPPVNFNLGGAVQYFDPANENRVAGAMPGGRLGEFYTQFQPVYAQVAGIGDREKETKQLEDAAQADLLFSLARFGLNLASPEDTRRSPAEQLAAAAKDPLAMAQVRMGELAKDKRALTERDKAANLAALQAAQGALTAEEKAKTERLAQESAQKHDIFVKNLEFDFKRAENESNQQHAFRLQDHVAALNAQETALDRTWRAKEAVLERAAREGLELNRQKFEEMMREKINEFTASESEKSREFTEGESEKGRVFAAEQAGLNRNIQIAGQEFDQWLKKENLNLAQIQQKWSQAYQDKRYALDEALGVAKIRLGAAELALKREEIGAKQGQEMAKQDRDFYKEPSTYLPALFNTVKTYKVAVPGSMEGTLPGAGEEQETRTIQKTVLDAWRTGQLPANHPDSKKIAYALENFGNIEGQWQGGQYVQMPGRVLSPSMALAVLERANLKDTDISQRVKTKAELMLMTQDPKALSNKINEIKSSAMSMLDGIAAYDNESSEKVAAKAAQDINSAFALGGITKRTIDAGSNFAFGGGITGGAANRGAYILKRVFVDGLSAAMEAMTGKENVQLQQLLQAVTPGNEFLFNSPREFYNKSKLYIAKLDSTIKSLEDQAERSGDTATTQKTLAAMTELVSSRRAVAQLMEAIRIQHPGSIR